MRKKTLALITLVALTTSASAQVWVTEPAPWGAVARGEGVLRRAMLARHNAARADFGVGPLVWDQRLTDDARAYARHLARTDDFRHSTGPRGAEPQGENLWRGTRLAYEFDEMVGHWIAERRDFRPGVLPYVSRTGRFEDVSHYTQLVWPTTRRVGCAIVGNRRIDYLVCRYAQPGNLAGRRLVRLRS